MEKLVLKGHLVLVDQDTNYRIGFELDGHDLAEEIETHKTLWGNEFRFGDWDMGNVRITIEQIEEAPDDT